MRIRGTIGLMKAIDLALPKMKPENMSDDCDRFHIWDKVLKYMSPESMEETFYLLIQDLKDHYITPGQFWMTYCEWVAPHEAAENQKDVIHDAQD